MRLSTKNWDSSSNFDWRVGAPFFFSNAEFFDNEIEALVWWHNQPDRSKLIVQHRRPSTGWATITPSVVKGD